MAWALGSLRNGEGMTDDRRDASRGPRPDPDLRPDTLRERWERQKNEGRKGAGDRCSGRRQKRCVRGGGREERGGRGLRRAGCRLAGGFAERSVRFSSAIDALEREATPSSTIRRALTERAQEGGYAPTRRRQKGSRKLGDAGAEAMRSAPDRCEHSTKRRNPIQIFGERGGEGKRARERGKEKGEKRQVTIET